MNKSSDECISMAQGWYKNHQSEVPPAMVYAFYYLAYALVMTLKEFIQVYRECHKN